VTRNRSIRSRSILCRNIRSRISQRCIPDSRGKRSFQASQDIRHNRGIRRNQGIRHNRHILVRQRLLILASPFSQGSH
jgi:hypothetical protein